LQGKERRRRVRNIDVPKVGLRKLGLGQRGMLGEASDDADEGRSAASEEDVVVVGRLDTKKGKGKRRARDGLSASKTLGKEELTRQTKEIKRDKENIHVRRVCPTHLLLYCKLNDLTEPDKQRDF
jgi:division protein 1